ncbi:MAG: glycosyl hydrolase [Marinagarivorans sp.]|nr:glycosyl hydrolase [Marinagarivorans sp.]
MSDESVPVLFSPFPSMNTSAMWYGPQGNNDKDDAFIKLWNYTIDKIKAEGLKNIIWVYAPRAGRASERITATWGYPGINSVDVVAPIAFSDEVNINNFDDYKKLDKPLGMTRLSPISGTGEFDNTIYAAEWEDQYGYLAYWIADHDDANKKHSLYGNKKYSELFKNSKIATTETIKNKEWLKQ